MGIFRAVVFFGVLNAVGYSSVAAAQDFNPYILKSVDYLYSHYRMKGYDIRSSLTHDVDYGGKGVIKASNPPRTMCVAAVLETIIEAIKLYAEVTGDNTVFDKIPIAALTKGNVFSLRANIFIYEGTGSHGTAFTLARFDIGKELPFAELKPGDFINFNRTNNTGHSVVFLGFLGRDLKVQNAYGSDVVGFRYFSSQGRGKPDGGLGYRNGFFRGFCPAKSDFPRDCNIMLTSNSALLNTGRMSAPNEWAYLNAVQDRKSETRSAIESQNPGATKGTVDLLVDEETQKELQWSPNQQKAFENESTDD